MPSPGCYVKKVDIIQALSICTPPAKNDQPAHSNGEGHDTKPWPTHQNAISKHNQAVCRASCGTDLIIFRIMLSSWYDL